MTARRRAAREPSPAELAATRAMNARVDEAMRAVGAHPCGQAARLLRRFVMRPLWQAIDVSDRLERWLYAAARRRLAARFPDLARNAPWW